MLNNSSITGFFSSRFLILKLISANIFLWTISVRVIECLVALGEESIRDALYEEMKDELVTMAKSKYASFFVQKLVKYGTKVQRDAVFKVRFLVMNLRSTKSYKNID